jgi:gluconate 2-dehydrogenase gamma chain
MEEDNKPDSAGVSRRELFRVIGSAPAIAVVTAGAAHSQTPAEHPHASVEGTGAAKAYRRKVFDDRQWRTVRVLCDLIIPADERSGSATQAGVPEFIDDWLNFRTQEDGKDDATAEILGGLAWLDRESMGLFAKNFADAAPNQQKQILDRVAWPARAVAGDRHWLTFFNRFRDLTVSGFFSSKMGIADLPYLGNRAVAEWKGCDPAVWTKIEERLKNGYSGLGGDVKPMGE